MSLKHFAVVATVAVAGMVASAETVTSLIGNTSQSETMLAAKPYPGARLNVTKVENDDCETYTAEVTRTGLMLLIK